MLFTVVFSSLAINQLHTTTEDPPTVPVTAIIVGVGKRKIEIEVVKELFPKRGKETEEVIVEEGVEKLKKVKIVMIS